MFLKACLSFLLIFTFLLPANKITAQNVAGDSLPAQKQISILNNKLLFQFPGNAVVSPRVADIMAADPNENKETRIIVDSGKMRLVFFAQELFSTSDKNMFTVLNKQVEPDYDFQRKILTDTASLLAVLSTPALFDTSTSAILVNSLTVKSPDNTVSRIDAYINPDAMSKKDEYIALTEQVFKTIVTGSRKINLAAKDETYKIPGTEYKFTFKLPAEYFITLDEKFDFSIFKINKYKPLDDESYTSITIYTGRYPTYFHKEYGLTDSAAIKQKDIFLLSSYDWLFFNDEKNNFFLKEQIIAAEVIEKGLLFHVALLTNRKELVTELSSIIEKIKLVK